MFNVHDYDLSVSSIQLVQAFISVCGVRVFNNEIKSLHNCFFTTQLQLSLQAAHTTYYQ